MQVEVFDEEPHDFVLELLDVVLVRQDVAEDERGCLLFIAVELLEREPCP